MVKMINTSNEYKAKIRKNRLFIPKATVVLSNGTVLNLDKKDLMLSGIKIQDSTSRNGSFDLGSAVINQLTITLNNFQSKFSSYDFDGAVIIPYVGLQLSSTVEYLKKGVFTAYNPVAPGSTIVITALDNMAKADKPFKDVTIAFPTTAQLLLSAVCTHCEISLLTTVFTNGDYSIDERPLDDAISCREILAWIAQLSGNYARCNVDGELELKWYDIDTLNEVWLSGGYFDASTPYSTGDSVNGGNFEDYSSGDEINGGTFNDMDKYHHIFSLSDTSIAIDDVVITGIQVTDSSETPTTVLYGQSGYVISIEGNKLIQSASDAQTIANTVGTKIVGMRFRPLSVSAQSDPCIEAGDIAIVTDRKRNSFRAFISNLTYSIGNYETMSCDAESPVKNNSIRYLVEAKTIIESKKYTQNKITAYDLMVHQLNNLVSHSFGVYKTAEEQEDGSVIYYMHDKPTLAESVKIWKQTIDAFAVSTDGGQTYTAGFDVEGNAVVNVLSAIGINADWIRTGKLLSNDGATLIDMAYGVANTDNISFNDNIQNGFPLAMPFNIDNAVSKINSVLLKFTQQPFRTYSTTTESGGDAYTTSGSGGGTNLTSGSISGNSEYINSTTGQENIVGGHHTHTYDYTNETLYHTHQIDVPNHTHDLTIPSHIHELNFGIQEQAISDDEITVHVDGTLRATTTNVQGIIDLTSFITTTGWHTIEIRSTTLKRVSAQINLKSYVRS